MDETTCNWDTFSFEEELEARKTISKTYLEGLRTLVQENSEENDQVEAINTLESHQHYIEKVKLLNKDLCIEGRTLMNDSKTLLKNIENLKSHNAACEPKMKDLTESVNCLTEEIKQHKKAYDIALKAYLTNFDLNVEIENVSNELFTASVKFNSVPNMIPIKVLINRVKRSIIEVNSDLLEGQENICIDKETVLENTPLILARIRQHLLNQHS